MADLPSPIVQLLRCPKCNRDIESGLKALQCPNCQQEFPEVDGIPIFVSQPEAWLLRWRNALDAFLLLNEREENAWCEELKDESLLPETRERVSQLVEAQKAQRAAIAGVMKPIVAAVDPEARGSRTEATALLNTSEGSILSYFANLLRDWGWSGTENAQCFEAVQRVLGGNPELGKFLVMGAGACRLAYDLHRHFSPEATLAIDTNALLLLATKRIVFDGDELEFRDFLTTPKEHALCAPKVTCSAPAKLDRDRFGLMFANALRPPFQDSSIDTVLTPWFIDVVPRNLKFFLPHLNRILKKGGRWVNFGPLGYSSKQVSSKYGRQEIIKLSERSGFALGEWLVEEIPYLKSPNSCHSRFEEVIAFSATKLSDVPLVEEVVQDPLPAWARDPKQSVPVLPEFSAAQILNAILSLVNGQRAIPDIAAIVALRHQLDPQAAERLVAKLLVGLVQQGAKAASGTSGSESPE